MSIALIVIFVVAVIAQGVLLWKGRGGWRWFHITSQVLTLMLAIAILFPTAGVLSSRNAWNKVKEELDARLAKAEAEQKLIKYGDPADPAAGEGIMDLQSRLQRVSLEAGRRWPSLQLQNAAAGTVTLSTPAPAQPEVAPGLEGEAAPEAPAAAPAAPAQPLVPQGLVVYGFAEGEEPGVSVPVPVFYLGEFKVTASTPTQVTLAPVGTQEPVQVQAIAGGRAQSWTLYELVPLDGHNQFIAAGSDQTENNDNIFGRVDEEMVKRLLGNNVSPATLDKYLRDGSRSRQDDPPATRWVKIEFTKNYQITVDSPEKRNVLDGGFFDPSGQSVDSRLQRVADDGGVAKFDVGDQLVVKEEAAAAMIEEGVAKLLDTYFVRELNDYRVLLQRTRLRITELAIRQGELEYEQKVLEDAIAATNTMLTANQEAKLMLEKDLAQIQKERSVIRTYTDDIEQKVGQTRENLVALYRENLQLAAKLREIHQKIAAAVP